MSLWVKPNGTEIEVNNNSETVEYVTSLGWKRKMGRTPAVEPKKRGRPAKSKD